MIAFTVPSEAALTQFGADMARALRPGDRIGLTGALGAGKTTLARAVIRALAHDPFLEVPSPTFTLVQDYDLALPLRHADLYRTASDEEVDELGLGRNNAVELIEWPRGEMPVSVHLDFVPGVDEARAVEIDGTEDFAARLSRARDATRFLADAGWGEAWRAPLKLDASTRRYERLSRLDGAAVFMDAPAFVPAVGAYARRARLADGNLAAFLAVGAALRDAGLSAPRTLYADIAEGFLLLEDFGDEKIAGADGPIAARYETTMDALAHFHSVAPLSSLSDPATQAAHTVPVFDEDLCAVEVGVFEEWYLERAPDPDFADLWRAAIDALPRDDDRLAMRDVHSPNVLWREGKNGIERAGFIDYQDAMIAPSAYDVVSLAQDARVEVPRALEDALVERYLAARDMDREAFLTAYHVLGAERSTRILGVFRRLNVRDGKPQYLQHLPRLRRQLARNLAHPALRDLRAWYAAHTDLAAA